MMDIEICQEMAICGLRDGNLIVFDTDTLKTNYGFGAMSKGSIVRVKFSRDFSRLLICGDDPLSILLKFN